MNGFPVSCVGGVGGTLRLWLAWVMLVAVNCLARGEDQVVAAAQKHGLDTAWRTDAQRDLPMLQGDQRLKVPRTEPKPCEAVEKNLPQFDVTMVSGDRKVVEGLQLWRDWSEYVVFNPVTTEQVKAFHRQLIQALRELGYVFAQVTFPTRVWSLGIFVAKVDLGVQGTMTVRNQRHYSAEQITRALKNPQGRFNYVQLHSELFDLNVKPDLKLSTQLSATTLHGRRVILSDIDVHDKLPVHGAAELSNTGSKDSASDWRIRLTLQHLNLTKQGDALTLDYLTGGDVTDSLNAYSASYFLPLDEVNHLTVYGGYNDSQADEILTDFDVRGKGFFAGFAWTHTLYETVRERIELALGWFYHRSEEYADIGGERLDSGTMAVSMPSLTLGYSSKIYDRWNGRSFASISLRQNKAGTFRASTRRQFEEASGTDGDFLLATVSAARFQRLFAGEDQPGKWTLYATTGLQLSSDALPSFMRDYVGGLHSIRGYQEAELSGDHAWVGTLELRTPLLENFLPGLKHAEKDFFVRHPEHWSLHRMQWVVFTDWGMVAEKHADDGEQGFWSLGMGLRLGLTTYAQMSLDYGFPLIEATEDTPESGRLHLSLQVQF